MDILLIVGRVLFGSFFAIAGAMHLMKLNQMTEYAREKGAPFPRLSVIVTGIIVLLSGIGVIFNFYQTLALLVIAAFIAVITPIMHAFWKEADPSQRMIEMQMFLKNIALLGASVLMYAAFV